jgi:soluble lytic murein transglycosylase-like protein
MSQQRAEMIALIREKARAAGLPEEVALATAEVESGFNPDARGDLQWHTRKGGELYRKNVLANPRLAANPARLQPERWVSFGLFQLLSPHFVEPHEAPEVLADPDLNAERGVRYLKRLYAKYQGDTDKVRVHYAAGNLNVSDATRTTLLTRFRRALAKWRSTPSGPSGGPLLGLAVLMMYFLWKG